MKGYIDPFEIDDYIARGGYTALAKALFSMKPEDVIEAIEYDANGEPVDNIPFGDPAVERMSKTMAKPEFAKMQSEIRSTRSVDELKSWAEENANRTATLPNDWQEFMRDCYRGQLEHLRSIEKVPA